MFLGGLWHGAGWTFIAWGSLHGFYLIINQAWHALRRYLGHDLRSSTLMGSAMARVLTFTAVVVAWVLFRSDTIGSAFAVYRGMAGMNGIVLPEQWLNYYGIFGIWLSKSGVLFGATPAFTKALQGPVLIGLLLSIVCFMPNTQQFMQKFEPAINIYRGEKHKATHRVQWSPDWKWAMGCALAMTAGIIMMDKVSEFLYFQF